MTLREIKVEIHTNIRLGIANTLIIEWLSHIFNNWSDFPHHNKLLSRPLPTQLFFLDRDKSFSLV